MSPNNIGVLARRGDLEDEPAEEADEGERCKGDQSGGARRFVSTLSVGMDVRCPIVGARPIHPSMLPVECSSLRPAGKFGLWMFSELMCIGSLVDNMSGMAWKDVE
ncbi:uncharacterized protein MYCFIDRAFT_81249 [Pseudocercospora fijiensis CIRAD86]|uniref:Uncharacterized protein n=1 Tax=Pseudocercospora fijiensis (strain CIRAD86) TaxID=383855 RepID=M3ART9_PSEFD|nr:uncharacterized protein MYCFIDRAFT_81249 [Pseudocercospora fijiensis CIRAD86]EME79783.1 hypothetical protein MYCFIDRAFT_81249 [Pseudocercospora fijiensis CIRAD86]